MILQDQSIFTEKVHAGFNNIIVEFVKQRSHMVRDIKNRLEDSVEKVQKGVKIADASLITDAKVAGKIYR